METLSKESGSASVQSFNYHARINHYFLFQYYAASSLLLLLPLEYKSLLALFFMLKSHKNFVGVEKRNKINWRFQSFSIFHNYHYYVTGKRNTIHL